VFYTDQVLVNETEMIMSAPPNTGTINPFLKRAELGVSRCVDQSTPAAGVRRGKSRPPSVCNSGTGVGARAFVVKGRLCLSIRVI
jgi:hypothetical protein